MMDDSEAENCLRAGAIHEVEFERSHLDLALLNAHTQESTYVAPGPPNGVFLRAARGERHINLAAT